nr:calmodulin-binding protein [Neorhodopirellula lusitana]
MIRPTIILTVAVGLAVMSASQPTEASAQGGVPGYGAQSPQGYGAMGPGQQPAFGQAWGSSAANVDWNRFYHYPYVYYPQNFYSQDYFKSSDSLYHRYPQEMRIPVYNKQWHNYYPSNRRFHSGHHFILDTF